MRYFALKGLYNILPAKKKEKKFSILHNLHVMLYHCSSYLQKTTNTPTCDGGERGLGGGGGGIGRLFDFPPFKDNVSVILLPIAGT